MHSNATTIKTLTIVWTAAVLLGGGVAAQQAPTFRAGIDMVVLDVAVTDKNGAFAPGLTAADFSIFERGREQRIDLVQQADIPLSVMLLMDVSGSMQASLPLARKAAQGFVRALRPGDLASIVPFETSMHVPQPLTGDRGLLEAAIARTRATGYTALYDTVYIAVDEMRRAARAETPGRQRRHAMVLLTDGYDSSSLVAGSHALDAAVRSAATFYVIRLPGQDTVTARLESPDFVLGRLASHTGGRLYAVEDPGQLPDIYKTVKAELDAQYLLAYRSDDPRKDGRFRQVAVHVNRPGLTVRTRPGYFAEPESTAATLRH